MHNTNNGQTEKIVSYLRVSSKGQAEGDGPERQKLAVEAFSKTHHLQIVKSYFDAYTGTSEDRPAFSKMLRDIDATHLGLVSGAHPDAVLICREPVTAVVVERMDRLARDLMASEFLLRELRTRGVKLYCADQGLLDLASDEVDPTRILIRQLMAALAQWEKSTLVKKLRSARLRAALDGRVGGRKPYGFLSEEQEGLRCLYEWHRQGHSYEEIADLMNARGYPSRTGVPWGRHTIYSIISRQGTIRDSDYATAREARKELAQLINRFK